MRLSHIIYCIPLISLLCLPALVMAGDTAPPEYSVNAPFAGTVFTYQGSLRDGAALASGEYDIRFNLYTLASGGSPIAPQVGFENLQIDLGTFTVQLDFGAAFDGGERYLEIGVRPGASGGLFTTLTPRQKILPTPYAMAAETALWNGLINVPAGFADNIDNDTNTTYSAGNGLQLNGTTFSLATRTQYVPLTVGDILYDENNLVFTGDGRPGLEFPNAAQSGGTIAFPVPVDYTPGTTFRLDLYYVAADNLAGNIEMFVRWTDWSEGDFAGTGSSVLATPEAANGSSILKSSFTLSSFNTPLPELIALTIRRNGNGVNDTYPGIIRLFGLRLSYTANG